MRPGEGKAPGRVIEVCRAPPHRRVAGRAGGGESRGLVIGLLGRGVIGSMTRVAIGRSVDVPHMPLRRRAVAGVAVDPEVASGERKARCAVHTLHPGAVEEAARVMAARALDAELTEVRIGMAIDTAHRRLRELEVGVTTPTGRRGVRSLQRKSKLGVIECRIDRSRHPALGRVAQRAAHVDATVRVHVLRRRFLTSRADRRTGEQQCDADDRSAERSRYRIELGWLRSQTS